MSDALKTATAVVGLLAGIVTGVYVLGGVVIALRLLFDHFDFSSVVTILGQLPREPVIATALLDVIAPAATFGLLAALFYGARNRPRSRQWRSDDLDKGGGHRILLWAFFPALSIGLCAPAIHAAYDTDGFSLLLLTSAIGIAVTYAVLATAWYLKRRVGRRAWPRLLRALAAGALWAVVALTPAVMIASAYSFEPAQVCTTSLPLPQKGQLIGEGGGRVLLEQQFGNEADVVALPSDEVTVSEYGDLSLAFVCPPPPGEKVAPDVAEAALEGHGSEREVQLATELRPRLLLDSRERWRPIEVGSFIGERFVDGGGHEVCWKVPAARCEPVSGLDQLSPGTEAPAYLDIHGEGKDGTDYRSPKRQCRATDSAAVDCNAGRRAVIYYRRTIHNGRWYWDYWWFLRYNEYTGPFRNCNFVLCSNHEGDWEGMTVVTTPSLEPKIIEAIYAAHRNRVLVEGAQLPLSDGHPLIFIAEGTHAGYPYRCESGCKQYEKKAGFRLPEDPHDGAVSWGGNIDSSCARYDCVQPLPEVGEPNDLALPAAGAWAGWRGQWGETCHRGCGSPLLQGSPRSPGVQLRFECPWVATDRALPAPDGSGLSRSEPAGDTERLLAACAAQRGGL